MITLMYKSCQLRILLRCYSSLNNNINISNEIKLPKKIFRDDFTVLKALSSCVRNEKGTPEYSAIDQPYTFPKDYVMRKKFYLSKASGRLSARMAFKEMKHEFINVALDEPKVRTLLPLIEVKDVEEAVRDKKLSVEDGLRQLIRLLSPVEAWSFYESHKSTKVSEEVELQLLQLLCATGGEPLFLETPPEDIYFSNKNALQWRLDCSAELLFLSMDNRSKASYCALIRGSAKHNNPSRALELYREMCEKHSDDSLDLATMNTFLRSLHHSDLSDEKVLALIQELLTTMSRNRITPSTHTFNNSIFAFIQRTPHEFIESLYQEMLNLGLEPTLGTYSLILQCSFPKSFLHVLLSEVVIILEERRATKDYEEITSTDDCTLFGCAMLLCRKLNDANLALRLNTVVDSGGRFHLFVNESNRGNYFDSFIKVLQKCFKVEEVIEMASKYVPKCYVLQPPTVSNLIDQIASIRVMKRKTKLLLSLMDLVNWNNNRNVKSDNFPKMLCLLQRSARDYAPEVIGRLQRIFDDTKVRDSSVLTVGNNLDIVIKIVSEVEEGQSLLWSLIDYAKDNRRLRVSLVAPIIGRCFQMKDFDRIAYLWHYLSECGESVIKRDEELESASLSSLIQLTDTVIIPTLTKFNINVKSLTDDVLKCRVILKNKWNPSEEKDEFSSSSDSE